jgi:hypothetical protein
MALRIVLADTSGRRQDETNRTRKHMLAPETDPAKTLLPTKAMA